MPKERLDISIVLKAEKAAKEMQNFANAMKRDGTKAARSLNVINDRLTRMRKNLMSMRTLVAGGIGVFAIRKLSKSFIDANDLAERLRLTLNSLLGSVEAGNEVFDDMAKFAARVPFTFEEIMKSATMLAGIVNEGADDINRLMPIITDLAATYNLTIEQVTNQIIRLMSAGAASADLFREKGINAMLGFEAGVKTSAERSKQMLFDAWDAEDSKFRNVSKKLAATWTGVMSMIADKWGQLMRRLGDLGLFQLLKDRLQEFDTAFGNFLDKNDAFFVERIPIWVSNVESFGSTVFSWAVKLKNIVVTIVSTYNSLPETVREWGLILALFGGKKIRILLVTLTALGTKFEWVSTKMKNFANFFEGLFKVFKGEISFGDFFTMNPEELQATLNRFDALKLVAEANKKAMEGATEAFKKMFVIPSDDFKSARELLSQILPDPEELEMDLDEAEEMYTDWAQIIYETNLELQNRIKKLEAQTLSIRENLLLQFGEGMAGVLSDGLQQWNNFFGSVLDGFKRMLAQMVAELAAKAAVFAVLNAVTGGGFGGLVGGFKSFLGFANGGFTGMGRKNEVAGVVHKNEFVIPQEFLQQNAGMLGALQGMQGGSTSNTTATFNVNISGNFDKDTNWRDVTRNDIMPEIEEAIKGGSLTGIGSVA